MRRQKLRFAMIGTGNFGPFLAQYINGVAEVVAICDPSPEARTRFHQITRLKVPDYDSSDRLFAEVDFDAVALAGPNHTHKSLTIAAAQAGKHVFCEKTMAPNVPDCWEMVRACEAANVRLMVGHKRRLRPPWARMIELREDLGSVVAISTVLYFDARPDNLRGWWAREADSGGVLTLGGVHEIDWMRAMCDDVEAVSAVSGPPIDPNYDFSDSIHVMLRFRNGAIGLLGVSLSYPLLRYRQVYGAEVMCRQGGMHLQTFMHHAELSWRLLSESETHQQRFEAKGEDPVGSEVAFRKEVGDFVRWVTEGTAPCLTWREGLRCVEVIEAARRSAKKNGSWIQLPLYPELETG